LATAEDVAHDFWSALCQHDRARALSLLADGAVFQPAGIAPANRDEALDRYLAATGEHLGSPLDTIALYEDMVIVERVGRVAGDPPASQRVIVSLVRMSEGRVTSWQDFFDPAAWAEVQRPHRRGAEPKRVSVR
jgi:ketosteroid isomerase-like protein